MSNRAASKAEAEKNLQRVLSFWREQGHKVSGHVAMQTREIGYEKGYSKTVLSFEVVTNLVNGLPPR